MINELSQTIHNNNKSKGFYDEEKNTGEIIALIHSEVSEALEAHRKGRHFERIDLEAATEMIDNDEAFKKYFESHVKDTFEDELADSIIRLLDLAAYKGIDIETHVHAKIRFNTLRPHKHGKKY